MGEARGKKGKKTGWQVTLGIKEVIFAGLGVAGLLMMSFALGTLAGRGDIYRVLHNWGLLSPDAGKAVQVWPLAALPPSTPAAAPASPTSQEGPGAATSVPTQTAVAKPPAPAPVEGAIAAPSSQSQVKKKSSKPEHKTKENVLAKMRRDVAPKLKFQNSLDPVATKTPRPGEKSKKDNNKPEKTIAAQGKASQVFIAKYRDGNRARAQLTKMRKQGDQVTLKEGKDSEGHYFAIYRQIPASQPKSQSLAQNGVNKSKTGSKPTKPSEPPEGMTRKSTGE